MNNKTFTPSPWVLKSALQKALRRGDTNIALRAARLLDQGSLLKRLRVIAVEDIGAANLPFVREVLLATPDQALSLVERMAGSIKSRDATNLYEAATINACHGNMACLDAARLMASRTITSGNLLADEVASLGFRLTREPLCFALPVVIGLAGDSYAWEPDTLTDLPAIHGWPSYAFDMYVREGKQAYRLFLKSDPAVRAKLERHTADPLGLLGHAMFVLESGLLDKRLVYEGSADILRLGQEADLLKFGVPHRSINGILKLVREHLPAIHQARCEVLIQSDNNQ